MSPRPRPPPVPDGPRERGPAHRPPGEHGPGGGPRSDEHASASSIDAAIDVAAVADLLRPWVPDDADRAFVVRCMLEEGPAHHRGATYALLRLLGEASRRHGRRPPEGPSLPVPMHVPPHLRREADAVFPLELPLAPLRGLGRGGAPAARVLADCLTDGPPHHALANAAMVCLLSTLLGDGAT
jgi:hypothetical protein